MIFTVISGIKGNPIASIWYNPVHFSVLLRHKCPQPSAHNQEESVPSPPAKPNRVYSRTKFVVMVGWIVHLPNLP